MRKRTPFGSAAAWRAIGALLLALPLAAAAVEPEKAAKPPAASTDALKYRFLGPPGNRVSAVVGVPGDPNTCYVGAASGGVWKSIDGGIHWKPVFDDQPAQSIGAIAIAPSDPNVVWVGTGEPFIRSNVSLGNGIYRSLDAGKTWTHMGLEKTGRIARVVIDPRNPDVVFAAALGTGYGPQAERGVYRTTDGGKSWERVLFVDENTGASDLAMDADNPRILYAGTWQIDIKTWGRKSGGPGSGVFVSRDGGTVWKRLTEGLPDPPLGKIAVAVAQSDSRRVYALIETGDRGSLWRSDDAGEKWKLVNHSRLLNERPHYYTRMLVMPDNANEVYFPSNGMGVTRDGGETAEQIGWGGDNHDMWADPKDARRMMIGNDGGVMISTTRGRQWNFTRLPIGQMYHVATDNRIPYFVYGQMQDDGSIRGPSHVPGAGSISPAQWTSTAGCETGWATPDPVDPNVVWGGCYAGVVERFDARTGMTRSVSPWPDRTMGSNAGQVKLRMNWTFPIAISPHDHQTVYVGSQFVHRTSDGGQSWETISPDLTTNDPSMMGDSGGLTMDNLSVEYAGVVFSIAESPIQKGLIWAGTNDGQVQVTRDGGAHWENVTRGIPGLPPKGTVGSVEPSRFDAGTCYVSVDLHQVDNRDPFLYRTADFGKTWKPISGGIPKSPLSYAHVVREDPFRRGLLYAGTENGLYVSFDDGARWEPLQSKLPHAPVYWLTIQEHFRDLVVGTYGRGFYILDDVSPLEQISDAVRASSLHVFEPRPAYRFRSVSRPNLARPGPNAGQNAPYGAIVNYWLEKPLPEEKKDAGEKTDEKKTPAVELVIFDSAGEKVRTLKGTNKAGMNRVVWDLRLRADGRSSAAHDALRKPARVGGEALPRKRPAGRLLLRHADHHARPARRAGRLHGEGPGRRPGARPDAGRAQGSQFLRDGRGRGGVGQAVSRDLSGHQRGRGHDQPARVDEKATPGFPKDALGGPSRPVRRRCGGRAREAGARGRGPAPAAHARGSGLEVVPGAAPSLHAASLAAGRGRLRRSRRLGQRRFPADESGARGLRAPLGAPDDGAPRFRGALREDDPRVQRSHGRQGLRAAHDGLRAGGPAGGERGRGGGRRRRLGSSRRIAGPGEGF